MGTICIYKGLSNECSKEIKGNGKLSDVVKSLYPDLPIERYIVIKEGVQINADYEIQDNDVIFLREAPKGAVITGIAIAISVISAAVAAGLAIASAVKQKELQDQLEAAQQNTTNLSQSVKQLPFLKGASNRNALGYNIPFVMGLTYHTPYLLTEGYYSIGGADGKNQYWNAVLVGGYANMLVKDVSIGNVKILSNNATVDVPKVNSSEETTETVNYLETDSQSYAFESGTYYDENNKIDLRTTGEIYYISGLDEKISCTSYGDEIPHKFGDTTDYLDGVVKQLATNTRKVEICVNFNGLRKVEDGSWAKKEVTLSFYWSNNTDEEEPTWTKFDTLTINKNSDETIRFSTSYTFTASQAYNKDISVKIVRETPVEESNSQETCYLCYINCWQYDAWKSNTTELVPCVPLEQPWRDKTLRMGIRIIANDSTKDTLDQINFMAYGTARIVIKDDNGNYTWSTEKYPTRNPASWILEILTSNIHSHSQYSDDEIDLDSLIDLYLYCADNEFYCDGIVTDDTKKADLLTQILTECNSSMYMDTLTGKWTFATEKIQTVPVALLNEQSIKSITVSKNFERKPYAYKMTYTDRTNWAVNTIYVSENGIESSADIFNTTNVITESTVKYITTYKHCYKYAHRMLARDSYQTREIVVNVGQEGDYYPLYSLVLLQMKHLKIGLSSGVIHRIVVENNKITTIQTSDLCDFSDTTKTYGIIIQASNDEGKETLYAKVTGSGKTRVLTLETPISYSVLPEYGNIYSFGYLDDDGSFTKVTNKMMIYGAKPSSNGWELTLKDYNATMFSTSTIPTYVPNLTKNRALDTSVPTPTYGDIEAAMINAKLSIADSLDKTPPSAPILTSCTPDEEGNITLIWTGSTDDNSGVNEYQIYYKIAGEENYKLLNTVLHNNSQTSSYTYTHTTSQKFKTHYYYIVAVDKMNNVSDASEILNAVSTVTTTPNVPTNLTAIAYENYIKLDFSSELSTSASLNPAKYKIEMCKSSSDEWVEISETSSSDYSYYFDRTTDGYPEASAVGAYQFRVKSVSVYGLESDYCTLESVDVTNYLGWAIGELTISSYATEGVLYIRANLQTSSYGEKRISITYGDETITENSSIGRLYAYKLNGYQEVADIISKDITLVVSSVADSVTQTLSGSNIDTSLYKTYKITTPTVSAYADNIGIHINWTDNTNDYYLNPTYTLSIDGTDVLSEKDTLGYSSLFSETEFPTAAEISAKVVKLTIKTDANSVEISNIETDISNYKGWVPEVPDLKISVSGRTVPISWNIQKDNVYDFLGCELQVAKAYKLVDDVYTVITDETELEWYAPALGLNPYESLDNYKKGDIDGYLSVKGSSVAFSVPLYGQDADGAISTMYAYRARAYTKGGKSDWSDTFFAEVKPVSAYDVVKAWNLDDNGEKVKVDGALGANQIFVNELSAICANLGYITDGALHTDAYNYWAVNDTPLEDGSVLAKGSFRVGGADEYLEVSPILDDNGNATGDYTLTIVAQKMTTTTEVTILNNKMLLVRDNDGNILFKAGVYEANPDVADDYGLENGDDKNYIRVNEGYFLAKELRVLNSCSLVANHTSDYNFLYNLYNENCAYIQPLKWNNKIYYVMLSSKYLDWVCSISSTIYFLPDITVIDVYSTDSKGNVQLEFSVNNIIFQNKDIEGHFSLISLYNGYIYAPGWTVDEETNVFVYKKINLDTQEEETFNKDEIEKILLASKANTNFIEYKEAEFFCFMDNCVAQKVKIYNYSYNLDTSTSYNSSTTYYDKDGNLVTLTKDTWVANTYYTKSTDESYCLGLVNLDTLDAIILDDIGTETNDSNKLTGWTSDDNYFYFLQNWTYGSFVQKISKDFSTKEFAVTYLNTEIASFDVSQILNAWLKNSVIKISDGVLSFIGTYNCFKINYTVATSYDSSTTYYADENGTELSEQPTEDNFANGVYYIQNGTTNQVYNGIFQIKNLILTQGESLSAVQSSLTLSTISVYANYLGEELKGVIPNSSSISFDSYITQDFYNPLPTNSPERFFVSKVYKEDSIFDGLARNIFELTTVDADTVERYTGFEILGTVKETEISTNFEKKPLRGATVNFIMPISDITYFVLYSTVGSTGTYFIAYFKTYEQIVGTENPMLLCAAMFDTENAFVTTKKNTYETGIGFTGFYQDRVSKKYRYLLASGAYLEFDKDGKLVADVKAEKGDTGVSIASVKQTVTSTEENGVNEITVTLTDGKTSTFNIQNGTSGQHLLSLTDDDFNEIFS